MLIRHGALHIAFAQPAGLAWGGNTVEKIQHRRGRFAILGVLHLDLDHTAHRRGFYVEPLDVETLVWFAVNQARGGEILFFVDGVRGLLAP